MSTAPATFCTFIGPGIEVVSLPAVRGFITTIHGGRLDGERFRTDRDPATQHHRACVLARIMLRGGGQSLGSWRASN